MKRIITYSIIIAITLLSACRKSDNPNIPDLTRVPVPLITKISDADLTISKDDPAAFKGQFIVDNFFKGTSTPKKLDVVIIKNGDNSSVVHFKDDVTTYPTTFDITGADLSSLFGPLVLGDKFTIGADVTTENGEMFEAFPNVKNSLGTYISPYGSGINNLPGASPQITYSVVCPIVIEDFLGVDTVDDKNFWGASYPVTVTLESPGVLKVTGMNQQPDVSVLIYIDDKYYTANIPKQIIDPGSVASYVGPYTDLGMAGKGSVDACDVVLNMNVEFTVAQGSFGAGAWVLRK